MTPRTEFPKNQFIALTQRTEFPKNQFIALTQRTEFPKNQFIASLMSLGPVTWAGGSGGLRPKGLGGWGLGGWGMFCCIKSGEAGGFWWSNREGLGWGWGRILVH